MSLHDDFGMYYNGTYVGVQQNSGKVFPLWVDSVSSDDDLFDLRQVPRGQRDAAAHGEEAYNALVFNGSLYNGSRRSAASIGVASDVLIFELPNPKYIKVDGRYYWCSYRANRSTKKGMCERRFASAINLTAKVAYEMFNETEDENIFGGIFLRNGNKLDYKGVPVGEINGLNITMYAEAAHLVSVLQKEWPECQIALETQPE